MNLTWQLIRRSVPRDMKTLIVRLTSQKFRWWARDLLGGGPQSISDRIVRVADGRQFHIGQDYIYLPLHQGEEFEPDATSVVRQLVAAGDTVIDVGANYGWYTTLLAQCVGTGGRVVAFEPVPSTYERLLEHLELNGIEGRVAAIRSAVGKSMGEVTMHVFDQLSHSRSSISPLNRDKHRKLSAPIIDLDTFLRQQRIEKVDFVKCDVEGAELFVLQGGDRLFRSADAPIVLIELNDETSEAFGYTKLDLWRHLQQLGYDHFYGIEPVGRVRRVAACERIRSLDLLLACKGDRIQTHLKRAVIAAA